MNDKIMTVIDYNQNITTHTTIPKLSAPRTTVIIKCEYNGMKVENKHSAIFKTG